MELILDRWFHIMAGIVWIGLLYYFNFVQAVALPKAKSARIAFLASRTNTMLSIPMLFFMVTGSAHGLPRLF